MRFSTDRALLVSVQSDAREVPVIVYDLTVPVLCLEMTSYAVFMRRQRRLNSKTVVGAIYQVARFKSFLKEKECGLSHLSDSVLFYFREMLEAEAPKRAKGMRTRAQSETVNTSLGQIYDWVRWLQDTGRIPLGTVGPYPCPIVTEPIPGKRRWTKPLLLPRQSGRSSTMKPLGFVPTEKVKFEVLELLRTSAISPYVSERNALIQRLAERVGLRRDSICSLTVVDFSRERLDACENTVIEVRPTRQKNGYEDTFQVPLDLAYEICNFVDELRDELVCKKGSPAQEVFLSHRTGMPIEPRSVTAIFSRCMRTAGAPKGAAVHAYRHKYVQDEVEREMAYRLANGLDNSDESVCHAVSLRVGQKNPNSIRPYLSSYYSRSQKVNDKRVVLPKKPN